MLSFILKVLFLAIAIAILGVWGIIKQQREAQELLDNLYNKAKKRIVKELKNKERLSIRQIEDIIKGTKASLFWSKKKVYITEPKLVAKELVKKMIESGIVREEIIKGKKTYRLDEYNS